MKKTLSVLTVILILTTSLFACGGNIAAQSAVCGALPDSKIAMTVPEPEPVPEPELPVPEGEITLLVLGDSIARGYGLKSVEEQRFSAVLQSALENKFATVNTANYGVDGLTGAQLVEMLKINPPDELERADYVLISIGGNNVLGRLATLDGLNELSMDIDANVFVDYFRFLLSDSEEEKKALDYARETLNTLFKTANDAFSGEQFKSLVSNASKRLETELPEIIALIRDKNPNAEIIIQTVYNPYKGLNIALKALEHPLNLAYFGEMAVAPLNKTIEALADEYGYTVAPVWGGFEASSKQLTNAGFDILNAVFGLDPHPNAAGHSLIAEIYYKLITEE